MRDFALISCVSKKRDVRSQAGYMYTSDWFKKARGYVISHYSGWAILSAKYGLVYPWIEINPYEMTLNNMNSYERREWATRVEVALTQTDWEHIDIFAGKKYREFLVPFLEATGRSYSVPLEGMGIGQQLAWFKNRQEDYRCES